MLQQPTSNDWSGLTYESSDYLSDLPELIESETGDADDLSDLPELIELD
jgi:hypothetical protein